MKITELATEHIARFDEWAEKWVQVGLSTEPADFDRAIEAALKVYELENRNQPMIILRMGSPLGALVGRRLSLFFLRELKKMAPVHPSEDALDQILNQAWTASGHGHVGKKIRNQVMEQIRFHIRESGGEYGEAQGEEGVRREEIWDQAWKQIWEQVRWQVRWQVREQVRGPVWDQVQDQVWEQVRWHAQAKGLFWEQGFQSGATNAPYISVVSFFRDIVGLEFVNPAQELFNVAETLALSCGPVWWHENVLVISDRPEQIRRDGEGRLHNDAGPSICFRDGWSMYHWHGVAIPGDWVTGGPPSAKEALLWENMEQRQVACEMVGWKNILKELSAKVINEDDDPEIGILLEAEIPDSGKERFLKVRCGTGREFVLPVPPHVNTALEANAWTWDIEDYEYRPEVRT